MAVLVAFVDAVECRLLLLFAFPFLSLPLFLPLLSLHLEHVFRVAERVVVGKGLRVGRAEAKRHDCTHVEFRIDRNSAVQALSDLLAYAESNAVAVLVQLPVRLVARPEEGLEQVHLVLFADADPAVNHPDFQN